MTYADLHVHTTFSDGTFTPAEVVSEALRNNVSLLAVADHETTLGSRTLLPLCARAGISCVAACELSAMFGSFYLHVLAYGVSFDEEPFASLVARNRALLDRMSDDLVARLAADDPRISPKDYAAYVRDVSRGGWKGIDYLYARGVTPSPMAGAKLYGAYGVTYERAGFPDFSQVVSAIRGAGGRAVLAHPGIACPDDPARLINALADAGLDGAECYYPAHTPEVTSACLAACRARGLLVTAGSDCHGAFGRARVGQTVTPREDLTLGDIKIL